MSLKANRAHRRTIAAVRAVVLDADGSPRLADRPEPGGAGELVHVRACGLCGSDVEKLGDPRPAGAVLGHEVVGELEDGVARDGDAPRPVRHAASAVSPATGRRAPSSRSCGSTRAVSPSGCARPTSSPLPDALGELDGIWVEPLACVLRAADLVPRGRVHVVGCGAIGRLWVQVLLRRGDEVVGLGSA